MQNNQPHRFTQKTLDIDKRVAARVRIARRSARVSQKAVAGHLGVSYQQFQKYETGSNRIGIGTLHLIADTLNVPLQLLLDPSNNAQADLSDFVEAFSVENAQFLDAFRRIPKGGLKQSIGALVKAVAAL